MMAIHGRHLLCVFIFFMSILPCILPCFERKTRAVSLSPCSTFHAIKKNTPCCTARVAPHRTAHSVLFLLPSAPLSWFWGDAHVRGGVEHAVFKTADSAVVLFDGECNFCNSSVWMMISNSDARKMRFCAQNVSEGGRGAGG